MNRRTFIKYAGRGALAFLIGSNIVKYLGNSGEKTPEILEDVSGMPPCESIPVRVKFEYQNWPAEQQDIFRNLTEPLKLDNNDFPMFDESNETDMKLIREAEHKYIGSLSPQALEAYVELKLPIMRKPMCNNCNISCYNPPHWSNIT